MTLAQWIDEGAAAHDGLDYSEVRLDGLRVSVLSHRLDGTEDDQPAGLISKDGVWDEACRAAGVVSQSLELREDRVILTLDYGGWTDEIALTGVCSPGAWLRVPSDLFEDFEAIIAEWEEENG